MHWLSWAWQSFSGTCAGGSGAQWQILGVLLQAMRQSMASDNQCSTSPGAQVHCAVEHALLLRCTLDETAKALEAAGVAPAIFTRLGTPQAPVTANCTAQQLPQQLPRACLDCTQQSAVGMGCRPDLFVCNCHAQFPTICAVWKQLEEQNPCFFQEYYKALAAQVDIAFLPSIVEASQMPMQ